MKSSYAEDIDGGDFFGNGRDGKEEGGGDREEEKEFGPILRLEEIMKETEARGAELPPDMLDAAKTAGDSATASSAVPRFAGACAIETKSLGV